MVDNNTWIMTTVQIKSRLIDKIQNSENEVLLEILLNIMEDQELEEPVELTQAQIEAIKSGLEEIESGKYITNEEANRQTEEWLNQFEE